MEDPNINQFCTKCGTVITLNKTGDIRCPLCHQEADPSLFERFERTVNLVEAQASRVHKQDTSLRTMIGERCPKCNHEGLYFTTAQLRSADEGQTIFYECPKCGHRFQQNA